MRYSGHAPSVFPSSMALPFTYFTRNFTVLLVCGHGNESGPILPQRGKDAFASFSSLTFLDLFLAEQGQWASPNFSQGFDNCFLPPSNQASLSEIWCKFSTRSSISFHPGPKAAQELADHTSDQHHLLPTPSTVSQPFRKWTSSPQSDGSPRLHSTYFPWDNTPQISSWRQEGEDRRYCNRTLGPLKAQASLTKILFLSIQFLFWRELIFLLEKIMKIRLRSTA